MTALAPLSGSGRQPVAYAAARVVAAVAASAFAFALYSRVEWPWFALGWVGLVPWLAALDRTLTVGRALAAGLLMSVAFVLAVFGWFAVAIANYTGVPVPLAVLVVIVLAPVLQPQFLTCAAARYLAQRRGAGAFLTAMIAASVYVGSEWALPKLFGDTIGHGFYASVLLRQAADLAGAPGLTFLLICANESALATIRPRGGHITPALCGAGIVLALLAYGSVRLRQLDDEAAGGRVVAAGIVQAGISHYGRLAAEMGTFDAARMILDTHFGLSADALARSRLDFLVWPETVYPTTFGTPKSADGAAFDREIAQFVNQARVPLIFGAYDVGDGREYNAAIFLEPSLNGRLSFDSYRKASLFPLTERVPAWLDREVIRRWAPWLGTWQPGKKPEVVPLALTDGERLRVAPLICYDAVDPSIAIAAVRDGAEVIVTLSNDSWFASGEGPHLHLVVSAFRTLETRRPQIRATNTGISAVFDATGAMIASAGVDERAALVAQVTTRRDLGTLMLAWGDWFGPVALAGGLLLFGGVMIFGSSSVGRSG